MTERHSWSSIKAERPDTAARRAGYERARQAYELGAKVRQLRLAHGWSQEELARRLNTTQSVIARMEAGGVEPRFSTLERIAEILDADLVIELRPRPVTGAGT